MAREPLSTRLYPDRLANLYSHHRARARDYARQTPLSPSAHAERKINARSEEAKWPIVSYNVLGPKQRLLAAEKGHGPAGSVKRENHDITLCLLCDLSAFVVQDNNLGGA